MVEVFLLVGVVIPIVACYLFFGDEVGLWQIIGILILLVAIYFMCTYNNTIKGKLSTKAFLLLLLCGVANGITDFSQKLFTKVAPQSATNASFNFYTYIFATITLLVTYFIIRKADEKSGCKPRRPLEVVQPIWYYVLIMAVCLFINSFFKTEAAKYLDAVQLYPLNQGCAVLLSLLMSTVLFKEKINAKCTVGIFLSFVALLIINLL